MPVDNADFEASLLKSCLAWSGTAKAQADYLTNELM